MNTPLTPRPIVFRLDILYYVICALPIASALMGIIIYSVGGSDLGYIPSFPEMMDGSPQCRFFGPAMAIESCAIIFFGMIRDHLLILHLARTNRLGSTMHKTMVHLTRMCAIIAAFALFFIVSVPMSYSCNANDIASTTFYFSVGGYFMANDMIVETNYRRKRWSTVASSTFLGLGTIAMIVRVVSRSIESTTCYGVSSITEYMALVSLVFKFVCMNQEVPGYKIRVVRRAID